MRGSPLTGEEPWLGSVIVFDDVTALLQAERNAAWSEVARRLAHEIKNPLTPIQLSAERLQLKLVRHLNVGEADILERATRTIIQQVEALKTMVNAFSEYARPARYQPVSLNLASLVEEVVNLYPPAAKVLFQLDLASGVPAVWADPVRMRQVLHNLIKNALEATEAGIEAKVCIDLRTVMNATQAAVELAIRDNGPGIGEAMLDSIFDPYVTTKAKGSGLGLAIVKKIIEEHNGLIWLDKEYQAGARFVIRLPCVPEPARGLSNAVEPPLTAIPHE